MVESKQNANLQPFFWLILFFVSFSVANEINNIFGLSIIFSVMSSSFTLCLVAYQMLDDVSMFTIVKAFILLLYESKQVIITSYIGQKLKECVSMFQVISIKHVN